MWFWYGFLGAFFAALTMIYSKHLLKGFSSLFLSWATFAFTLPFYLILAIIFWKNPTWNYYFLIGVIGSAAVFAISKFLAFETIKSSALSEVYPINAFSTIFTFILSFAFLGEKISFGSFLGLVVATIGLYIFGIKDLKNGIFKPVILMFKNRIFFLRLLQLFFWSFFCF